MQYMKRPIPIDVEFASHAGTLQTLEGEVGYEAGDALMTGVKGERWPIRRQRFESTYAPVAPTQMGESGQYLKKPVEVSARQAKGVETIELQAGAGTLQARPGDWIVTAPDGHQWVVANDIFHATYQQSKD